MSVTVKTPEEIELMAHAGKLLGQVHEELAKNIREGMSTKEVDALGEELIRSYDGCTPNFLNLYGYPGSVCVSINDEVVHGIPRSDRLLLEGDIVSLDTGLMYKGYHSDAARTVAIGEIPDTTKLLIDRTRQSFFEGIKAAKAGNRINDIGRNIEKYINQFGYGIVRDLTGHGIGTALHEDPTIYNFKRRFRGLKLKSGMTLAVEPMINEGLPDVCWMDDEWTVVTLDETLSAHYENTIVVTEGKPRILTLTPSELKVIDEFGNKRNA